MFKTVSGGELTLDKNGTVKKQLTLYKIVNGKLDFEKNVKAE